MDVIWWNLAPYVHQKFNNDSNATGIPNRDDLTGFVYDIFMDSASKCLGFEKHDDRSVNFKTREIANQGVLLDILTGPGQGNRVGMPVILESSSMQNAPNSFVRVLGTTGLTWVYHHDPPAENVLLQGLSAVWPILCVVIIFTGYAAFFIWFAERWISSNPYFDKTFYKGILDSYWYAFASATTVGYGDKVPQSPVGKLIAMIWIICGICAIAVFTATITTFFGSLTEGRTIAPPPLHNAKVGVLNSSIDFRLVSERGAQAVEYGTVEELLQGMERHEVDSVAVDPNVYCVVYERIGQNFEFRVGATSATTVGYIFQGLNQSLLECMKNAVFYQQGDFDRHLEDLYLRVQRQREVPVNLQENIFGSGGGWFYIGAAASGLLILYLVVFCIDSMAAWYINYRKQERYSSPGSNLKFSLLFSRNDDSRSHSRANSNSNSHSKSSAAI